MSRHRLAFSLHGTGVKGPPGRKDGVPIYRARRCQDTWERKVTVLKSSHVGACTWHRVGCIGLAGLLRVGTVEKAAIDID